MSKATESNWQKAKYIGIFSSMITVVSCLLYMVTKNPASWNDWFRFATIGGIIVSMTLYGISFTLWLSGIIVKKLRQFIIETIEGEIGTEMIRQRFIKSVDEELNEREALFHKYFEWCKERSERM